MVNAKKFTLGLSTLFIGFRIIRSNRSLWLWALIPFFINLLLFVSFLSVGFGNLSVWVGYALKLVFTDPSGWLYSLLYYPLYFILAVGFVVVSLFLVYLLASVISSPFHSVMAEKVLMLNGALETKSFRFGSWLRASINMFFVSLVRTLIFAFVGLFLFLGSFIPGLNFVMSYFAFLMMAFDSMDYTYEAVELPLGSRFQHFRSQIFAFSGTATVIGLTLLFPGLTLLAMPLLVAGGAEVYARLKSAELEKNEIART